jgi:hypothetical protein
VEACPVVTDRVLCDVNIPAPLIGKRRRVAARPHGVIRARASIARLSKTERQAAAAQGSKGNGSAQRSITCADGMPVIARLDEPFPAAIRTTANDADMVRPYNDGTNLRPACVGADTCPVACQIESRISDTKHVPHIRTTPRASVMGIVASVMSRIGVMSPIGVMMAMMLPLRGKCWTAHTNKRKAYDAETTHTNLRFLGRITDIENPACNGASNVTADN